MTTPSPGPSATDRPAPWRPGSATGVGSLSGTDPAEACRLVFGELPDLPHLPELPGRGLGADLVGRTAALLAGLYADVQPAGWRLVPRPGRDQRRAADLLRWDLDALEEVADGYAGPLKVQAGGPWTLAAAVELPRGDKALADAGAVRDLADALAEGLSEHVAEVRRRVPGAGPLLVQLDEPGLPPVLSGRVPTASGFGALPAVDEQVAQERLATVVDALAGDGVVVGLHCCAPAPPVALARRSGARFLALDMAMLTERDDEQIGEAVEAGAGLLLGVVPAVDTELSGVGSTVGATRALWRRLGFPAERLAEVAVLTPACGLAGATPAYARAVLRHLREAARAIYEDPR